MEYKKSCTATGGAVAVEAVPVGTIDIHSHFTPSLRCCQTVLHNLAAHPYAGGKYEICWLRHQSLIRQMVLYCEEVQPC